MSWNISAFNLPYFITINVINAYNILLWIFSHKKVYKWITSTRLHLFLFNRYKQVKPVQAVSASKCFHKVHNAIYRLSKARSANSSRTEIGTKDSWKRSCKHTVYCVTGCRHMGWHYSELNTTTGRAERRYLRMRLIQEWKNKYTSLVTRVIPVSADHTLTDFYNNAAQSTTSQWCPAAGLNSKVLALSIINPCSASPPKVQGLIAR